MNWLRRIFSRPFLLTNLDISIYIVIRENWDYGHTVIAVTPFWNKARSFAEPGDKILYYTNPKRRVIIEAPEKYEQYIEREY